MPGRLRGHRGTCTSNTRWAADLKPGNQVGFMLGLKHRACLRLVNKEPSVVNMP
jgi:hypothetical protein